MTCVLRWFRPPRGAQSCAERDRDRDRRSEPANVDKARSVATSAAQKLATLVTQRAPLVARYQQQLAAIDSLKKQKASWRRDRELNTAQANANDTATRLTALDKQIGNGAARGRDARARRSSSRSMPSSQAGARGARATQLAQIRAQLAPAAHRAEEDRHPRRRDRSARRSRGARAPGGGDRGGREAARAAAQGTRRCSTRSSCSSPSCARRTIAPASCRRATTISRIAVRSAARRAAEPRKRRRRRSASTAGERRWRGQGSGGLADERWR